MKKDATVISRRTAPWRAFACGVLAVVMLGACGPSDPAQKQIAERRRIECRDKLCEGDRAPLPSTGEFSIKLDGEWYFAPHPYVVGFSTLAFYWPSKTPGTGRPDGQDYPERGELFQDAAIEIALRSDNIPPEPRGYRLIELATAQGWIESRTTLRPGLDIIKMKQGVAPRGGGIDRMTYYVASGLRDADGLPPVAICNDEAPTHGGGTGFMWRPGVWMEMRMSSKHCADWPEIHLELMRVLRMIRKI